MDFYGDKYESRNGIKLHLIGKTVSSVKGGKATPKEVGETEDVETDEMVTEGDLRCSSTALAFHALVGPGEHFGKR